MEIDQIALAIGSILICMWGTFSAPKGSIGPLVIGLVAFVNMYLGPRVYGHDWYTEGFIAGLIIGDFFGSAMAHITPAR